MTASLPAAAAHAASDYAAAADVFYPCSDGGPMAENMWQSRAILNTVGDIESVHPEALVAADILVYPEEGERGQQDRAGRAGGVRHRHGQPQGLPGVGGRQAAGLGAGSGVAGHGGQGPGPQAGLLHRDAGAGVLAVRSEGRRVPARDAAAAGAWLKGGEYRPLDSRLVGGERLIRSEVLGLDVRGRASCFASGTRRRAGTCRIGPRSRRPPSGRRQPNGKGPVQSRKRPAPTGRLPPARPPRLGLQSWRLRCGVRGSIIRRERALDLSRPAFRHPRTPRGAAA